MFVDLDLVPTAYRLQLLSVGAKDDTNMQIKRNYANISVYS